jgi:hypothetical protein
MHVRNALLPDTEHPATFRTDIRLCCLRRGGLFSIFLRTFSAMRTSGGSAKTFFHHRLPVRITTAKIPNWAPQTATQGGRHTAPTDGTEHRGGVHSLLNAGHMSQSTLWLVSTFLHNTHEVGTSRKSPPQLVCAAFYTACFQFCIPPRGSSTCSATPCDVTLHPPTRLRSHHQSPSLPSSQAPTLLLLLLHLSAQLCPLHRHGGGVAAAVTATPPMQLQAAETHSPVDGLLNGALKTSIAWLPTIAKTLSSPPQSLRFL